MTAVNPNAFSCTWRVNNFFMYLDTYSPAFSPPSNPNLNFYLSLEEGKDHQMDKVSIELHMSHAFSREPITVKYRISLIGNRGEKVDSREFTVIFENFDPFMNQYWPSNEIIRRRFRYHLSRSYLYKHRAQFLTGNSLVIQCEGEIVPEEPVPPVRIEMAKLGDDFSPYLESGIGSDVTLHIGMEESDQEQKQLRAHKMILCTRSPVFAAMFHNTNFIEAHQDLVRIPDISAPVFEVFLRYLYTGKVTDLELNQFSVELIEVANMYQVDALKNLCEQHLIDTMNIETVCHLLRVADLHYALQLKKHCIEYITTASGSDIAAKVMATEDWKAVSSNPDLTVELFRVMFPKVEVTRNRKN